MLEKPNIPDETLVACLYADYGVTVTEVTFLALGADANTAVYRVAAANQTPYFLKLRSGVFDETSVLLPRFLHDQGIQHIIAPLATRAGRLWEHLDALDGFNVLLYPFIEGDNGWEVALTDSQWVKFGVALKAIHSLTPPPVLMSQLQRETYSPKWREIVRGFQARVDDEVFADPISAQLAALLKTNRAVVDDLSARAQRLAQALRINPSLETVICHADLHMGNLLITATGDFYIVDWDTVILAPKERDLMFIGGGIGRLESPQEIALFYEGYGETQIDPVALAYYRYERIVEDIAAYCEQILVSNEGDLDRAEGLRQLSGQFLPNEVIDIAFRSDRSHIS